MSTDAIRPTPRPEHSAAPRAAGDAGMARRVAVVGASSQIGGYLLPRLAQAGLDAVAIGRTARAGPADAGSAPDGTPRATQVHAFDEDTQRFAPPIDGAHAVICLAPLPVVTQAIRMARALGARRLIAFGSTGRFSKTESGTALEREFVAQQQAAEAQMIGGCEDAGIAWTLFRPTMVYGAGTDLNVAFIERSIRRFGCFPVAWGARGLRQPVHADDLAAACVAALDAPATCRRAYNLGGGERLPYPAMIRRIFAARGRRACLLPVPAAIYRLAIRLARRRPQYAFVSEDMVSRTFVDLVADHEDAVRDFGYAPRRFVP